MERTGGERRLWARDDTLMGPDQTEAYIVSRLQESGILSARKVSKKACQKIHQLSGGVPMQINRRANMMLDQLIKGQVVSKASILPKNGSVLWVAALFTSLTAGYLSLQALSEPEPTHQWVAQESVVSTPDAIEESLVLSSLDEINFIREEPSLEAQEEPNGFELVMAEAPEPEPSAAESAQKPWHQKACLTQSVSRAIGLTQKGGLCRF